MLGSVGTKNRADRGQLAGGAVAGRGLWRRRDRAAGWVYGGVYGCGACLLGMTTRSGWRGGPRRPCKGCPGTTTAAPRLGSGKDLPAGSKCSISATTTTARAACAQGSAVRVHLCNRAAGSRSCAHNLRVQALRCVDAASPQAPMPARPRAASWARGNPRTLVHLLFLAPLACRTLRAPHNSGRVEGTHAGRQLARPLAQQAQRGGIRSLLRQCLGHTCRASAHRAAASAAALQALLPGSCSAAG